MEHPLRKHLSGPIIGLMVTKDENDFLPRVIYRMFPYCDSVYALAGDDQAEHMLLQARVNACLRDKDVGASPFKDFHRQRLIELAQKDFPPRDNGNGWFIILHGDEIWHDDPVAYALFTEHLPQGYGEPGWDTVVCDMAQSYLTRRKADMVCFPACREERMFRNVPGLHYERGQNGIVRPLGISGRHFTQYRPVVRHFTYRNPEQAWRMAWDSHTFRRARQSSHDWILEHNTCYTDYSPITGEPLRNWKNVEKEVNQRRSIHIDPIIEQWRGR